MFFYRLKYLCAKFIHLNVLIMKKRLFLNFMAAAVACMTGALAASCSSEENSRDDEGSITFSSGLSQTKAVETASISTFKVSGSVYTGSYGDATLGNYFFDEVMESGAKTGYLWPGSGKKLSFYAYCPYSSSAVTLLSTTSTKGAPSYKVSVPADVASQVDICVAEVTDVAGDYNATVNLPFQHVMSAIAFNVKNETTTDITVKDISVYGVKGEGTYNGTWTLSGAASSSSSGVYTITPAVAVAAGATVNCSGTDKIMFVIPQTVTSGTEFVSCTVSASGVERRFVFNTGSDNALEKGKKYTYTISFTEAEPSMSIDGWEMALISDASLIAEDWKQSDVNSSAVDMNSWGMVTAESIPIDLGLPSGLKWASGNIGAKNPQDYGLYFAWGETTGYTAEQVTGGVRAFDDATYQAGPAASISADLSGSNDAATVNLGGNWRMPTKAEFNELKANCTSTWTDDYNGTGVAGRLFTSKVNGNSVFFPASGCCDNSSVFGAGSGGYYWSASWDSSLGAWNLYFDSGGVHVGFGSRFCGYSVRGVCE